MSARIDRIVDALWPPGSADETSTWAIVDAARDARVYPELRLSRLDVVSLYAGKLPDVLQRAAPCLVELAPLYSFTRPYLEMAWGNSWGVFLRLRDARNLRHHLRRFLRVTDESGRALVFRYYDPRVLRVYLPTCTKEELATVFGPIRSFLVESAGGNELLEFEFDGRRLIERRTEVDAQVTA